MVKMSFRAYWRDRGALFWGIALPVLLMTLIGLAFGGAQSLRLDVSVVAPAPPPATPAVDEALVDGLEAIDSVTVHRESEGRARAALQSGERNLVVLVPGVEPPLTVRVLYDRTQPQVSQAGLAIIRGVITSLNRRFSGAQLPVNLSSRAVEAQNTDMFDFLLPGIIALTIMQTGLQGLTHSVTQLRDRLVLKRLLTTPANPLVFIGGLLGRFTFVNVVQAAIIFAIGSFGFGARTVGSLWQFGLLVVLGSVVFIAMGLAVSTVAATPESANALGSAISFPMMFLSGVFFPKEAMPAGLQPLIEYLPLTPLVDMLRAVATRGESLAAFGPSLIYFTLIGVAATWLAARRFRWE